jgi:hypothetical protein
MGKILPGYQKAIIQDITEAMNANLSQYYAFAGNPVAFVGSTPTTNSSDYSALFTNTWQMLFGKKLTNGDIYPVILNNVWTPGQVYNRYDNTKENLSNYYVVTPPVVQGGDYNVFKCIDNANGAAVQSGSQPGLLDIQQTSFKKADGYVWRYITSIPSAQYVKVATSTYVPATVNTSMIASAYNHSGIEVVPVVSGGSGYASYTNGTVQAVVAGYNNYRIQIETTASADNQFYTGNAIYLYNPQSTTSQIFNIVGYTVDGTSGARYVTLNNPVNPAITIPNNTRYDIAPRVVFETDGVADPVARSIINPNGNSISRIEILSNGFGISWANVSIQSNTTYGSGANVYCIVPPPGGHGSNPEAELGIKGYAVAFSFNGEESGKILGNTVFNKIGLIKNPSYITNTATKSVIRYSNAAFSSVLQGNLSPTSTFQVGHTVIGQESGARGTVAFCNGTNICLTGDKYFNSGENITSSNGLVTCQLLINTLGDVYTKDLVPLYVQNISNVTRSSNQSETFKIIIKV